MAISVSACLAKWLTSPGLAPCSTIAVAPLLSGQLARIRRSAMCRTYSVRSSGGVAVISSYGSHSSTLVFR